MTKTVRAAGGVLWRPAPSPAGAPGIEVAVVHRPRYDDWSLPKGKLDGGEHPLVGALREVREETGFAASPGRTLGQSDYRVLLNGQDVPKTVRWWAMKVRNGAFVPNDEVDELRWLPGEQAGHLLTAGRDTEPLAALLAGPLETCTVLLVRHGRAGSKSDWHGPDDQRPLDEVGLAQAGALRAVLAAYGVTRVLSAPVLRCVATVQPLATDLDLPVDIDESFGEAGYAAAPTRARRRLRHLAQAGGTTVLCSQGGALPEVVVDLADRDGLRLRRPRARKGSVWALSFASGRLVDADYTEDPLDP